MSAKAGLMAILAPIIRHWNWTWLQTVDGQPIPVENTPVWDAIEAYAKEAALERVRDMFGISIVAKMQAQLKYAGTMPEICIPVPITVVRLLVEGRK